MKAYKKLQNILAIAAILLSSFAFGQAQTEYINYQGVARDASNEIIANQTISLGISLRFGAPTATVLYSETHNTVTTDISGVFSLKIGTGDVTAGIYKDLEWGKLAPYASIILNGSDVGTVALHSVPYANSSGKAVNMEIDDLTNVAGTPTSGQVLKFDGTDWTPATDEIGTGSSTLWTENGDNIYYNTGNVGIGTDIPAYPLDILTSTSIAIRTQSEGLNNFMPLSNNAGFRGYSGIRSNDMEIGTMIGNNTGKIQLTINEQPRLTLAPDGKVGIGVTSPTTALDVVGIIRASSLVGTGDRNVVADENGSFKIGTESSSIWKKGTGNNIFYNGGNVGIGTIQPMHPLDIRSSTSESIKVQSTSSDNWIGFHNSEGFQGYAGISWDDKDIAIGTALFNTTGKVHLATNSIPKLTVARNGNVGIGTVSPEVKLDVRGGDGNVISYEGDFRIGNSTHRLKMGVFTDGPDLGRASIRAVGGKNELYLGAGPGLETLRIKEDAVEITKKLNRPSTGNADLIPVAYGTISADGTIKSGTGNFRVERPGPIGYTLVIIDFVNFSSAHTSIVTLQGSVERAFISAGSEFVAGGYALAVKTSVLNDNGQPNGRSFQNFSFVVYKQ